MPSKQRNKLHRKKLRYATDSAVHKHRAHINYQQNAQTVKHRSITRSASDSTLKRKKLAAQKNRLSQDNNYRERNREGNRCSTRRRLDDNVEYANNNRAKARVNTKRRLQENLEYADGNRQAARVNTKRRLEESVEYADRNRQAARVNKRRRLEESVEYSKKNREMARVSAKRRLQEDPDYANRRRGRRRNYNKRRRQEDNDYQQKIITAAKGSSKRRWETDNAYRQKKKQAVRQKMKKKWDTDEMYRETKRRMSRETYHKTAGKVSVTTQQRYWKRRARLLAAGKERRIEYVLKQKMAEHSMLPSLDVDMLFSKARYIENKAKRTLSRHHRKVAERVAAALEQTANGNCSTEEELEIAFGCRRHSSTSEPYFWEQNYHLYNSSSVIPIDEMGRAQVFQLVEEQVNAVHPDAAPRLSQPHVDVSVVSPSEPNCTIAGQLQPGTLSEWPRGVTPRPSPPHVDVTADQPSEPDRTIPAHQCVLNASEPHEGKDTAEVASSAPDCVSAAQEDDVIPRHSKPHINVTVIKSSQLTCTTAAQHEHSTSSAQQQSTASAGAPGDCSASSHKGTQWSCNSKLCKIDQQSIDRTNTLLQKLVSTQPFRCTQLYQTVNSCLYKDKNPYKQGHSLSCSPENGCESLLKDIRLVSSHFPAIRTLVIAIYRLQRLSISLQAVQKAKRSGDFTHLQLVLKAVKDAEGAFGHTSGDPGNADDDSAAVHHRYNQADEAAVMEMHGKQLRQVAKERDTYVTTACSLCEQLKPNLKSLKSLESRKGYDSQQMTKAIEVLYQNKTEYEDVEQFKASTSICAYCANKLLGNKDVARSFSNKLSIVTTPDCLKALNLYERCLIKFCMTCITVVRLGQVTNKARPQNELTAALKGRIAYLPVDVEANAQFMPEDLLNIDSLRVVVAGQPTKAQRVWTSVVDLTKVHAALIWLRENNRLYKDIPAYTVQELQDIIEQKIQNSTHFDSNPDGALLQKLDDASKSFLYENFSIQPLSSEYPRDVLADYQLNKIANNNNNISIYDSDLDLKAFPELYPTAENGMRDARQTALAPSDFIKSRLLNANSKFRLNQNYLFHLFQQHEVNAMYHSVGHMLRTVTGNSLSAKDFYDRLEKKDGEYQSKMFSMLANVRGSREYFSKMAMDVKWMIRKLGPPTLFVTCSMAEWFSEPFISYLRTVNSDVPNINNMTAAELCAMDPVSVSIHFQQKWKAIFSKLINNKEGGIFGEVQDYFYRIEYQARGAGHTHTLLWIKDAPVIGKNSLEEVKQYIEKVCTCAKPDPETSPTLHELVNRFQTHRCNKYCTKTYKHNNTFYKKCRFGFPRPSKPELELNDVIDCLAVNTKSQPRKRLYHLCRTTEESHINDYNAALLLANQANVDVQYIAHMGSRLPFYITDYVTKHERSEQDDMWQDIFTSTKTMASNAMSFMLRSVKNRQVGANEAADRLLGHKLFSKSRQLRFADLQTPDKVKRILKPIYDLRKIVDNNPESCDIFQPHWVLDIYPDRPSELENSSLYEILSWYEKERVMPGKTKPLQLKSLPFWLRKRKTVPYIVTHQKINVNQSDEKNQAYYYQLLKLFKPWRTEEDLSFPGSTFHEAYVKESATLPDMVEYHSNNMDINTQEEELEVAIRERAQQQTETVAVEDDQHSALAGCATDHVQTAMHELVAAASAATHEDRQNSEKLKADYNGLNKDQKRVVDRVISAVSDNTKPIRLIVSGQGGTGKSRVIDVLQRMVSLQGTSNSLAVVVAAPTGLAAHSINGATIHRILCLPVEHGKPADYHRLNQDQLKTVQATMKNIKLLILDEVSMVSSLTLLYIHLRLTEIMCCNEYFGGLNVVFFADFLQLPPVKGNQPFIPVTYLEAKQRTGAIGTIDLWQTFDYDELTINMRQSGDKLYASLLADLRTGQLSDDQYALLTERLISPGRRATVEEICNRYFSLSDAGESPIILLPRTILCDAVNTAMLHRIGSTVHTLNAIDTRDTIVDDRLLPKVQKAHKKMEDDTTRTAGLEKMIQLCVGARVMLKRNKDVDAGLVNGSVGTVEDLKCHLSAAGPVVDAILVKFQTMSCPVPIARESCSFEVLKGVYYTRKQFPIMLAFGITVHKAQGLSLSSVIVDAGSSTFGCGMVYVALSRVTSLQGLHLIELERSKIQCDKKAIEEYNRLRSLNTPELEIIRTSSSTLNIFQHCRIRTVTSEFQQNARQQLNLAEHCASTTPADTASPTATLLEHLLYARTKQRTSVKTYTVSGDGNCLFRAISLGLTNSQQHHRAVRRQITDHMLTAAVRQHMEPMFANSETYNQHVENMTRHGTWGTEQEIIAAAHLFNCSIVCLSHNSQLQQFTPHFLSTVQCDDSCSHETIYITNTTGSHYNLATVKIEEHLEE